MISLFQGFEAYKSLTAPTQRKLVLFTHESQDFLVPEKSRRQDAPPASTRRTSIRSYLLQRKFKISPVVTSVRVTESQSHPGDDPELSWAILTFRISPIAPTFIYSKNSFQKRVPLKFYETSAPLHMMPTQCPRGFRISLSSEENNNVF